jgi:hypothetical protein
MDLLSAAAFKGALDVGDRIIEICKLKTDGSFYEQQEFKSRLREREAAIAAQQQDQSAAAADWRGLEVALATLSQTDRLNRILAANPFRLSIEDTKQLVYDASSDGTRPVLLETPISAYKDVIRSFKHEILDLDIGNRWSRHPCAEDVSALSGVIDRPLRHQDLDVQIIATSLSEVPVILIYGQLKADSTLWLSVYAWNIVAKSAKRDPLKIALPSLRLPDVPPTSPELRVWKDEVCSRIVTIIAMLAQWYYLVNCGRKPTLDKLASLAGGSEVRALLARQLIAAYEILAFEHSSADIRLDQAELYADAGMNAQASVFALSILDHVRAQTTEATDYGVLERLGNILSMVGDDASAKEAGELLEGRSKAALQRILGWVN